MGLPILCSLLFFLSGQLFAEPGVVVLAGGAAEGEIGIKTDWSYDLYKRLIDNGDTTGDKKIKVVVISLDRPTNFIADYLRSMGADSAHNLTVDSRARANDPKTVEMLSDADVVFLRGGNQARAYEFWKGTKLHEEINKLGERGGAIGGTSSGAMALSQYTITGGQDFGPKDVLSNSHSPLLNDKKNVLKSGIHNDFLRMVSGVMVDTHCAQRARVGRLMALMAKAIDDFKEPKMVGICLEEQTGVAIEKGKARVYGVGGAHFLTETTETKKVRVPGRRLSYVNVRNDLLTHGWTFDLNQRNPDLASAPEGTRELSVAIDCASAGKHLDFQSKETPQTTLNDPPFTQGLAISESSFSDLKKGLVQTYAFNSLAKNPSHSVIMLDAQSGVKGLGSEVIAVTGPDFESPSMILDCKECSHTSVSPFVAFLDKGDKSLHTSAIINSRIHIIGAFDTYNVKTHKLTLGGVDRECKKHEFSLEKIDELVIQKDQIIKGLKCF